MLNCPNHVRRTKSSIKKRIIVRRSVPKYVRRTNIRPVKNGLKGRCLASLVHDNRDIIYRARHNYNTALWQGGCRWARDATASAVCSVSGWAYLRALVPVCCWQSKPLLSHHGTPLLLSGLRAAHSSFHGYSYRQTRRQTQTDKETDRDRRGDTHKHARRDVGYVQTPTLTKVHKRTCLYSKDVYKQRNEQLHTQSSGAV